MNLEGIKAVVTSKAARQALLARKHSPKALFVVGTVGVIGTVVLACRATLKLDDVFEQHEKSLGDISETALAVEELGSPEYKREVAKLRVKTGIEIGKLYVPAVGLGVASIAALTGSHVILTKRNGAVMAAYAGLDRAYKEYRQRVSDEYGIDVDRKFAVGAQDVAIEEKTADGGTKVTKGVALPEGRYGGSPYAEVFDERSRFFSKEPGMNAQVIGMKQSFANDKLRANGHLFLNEVYDMLGLPRTKAGACVGWVYRKDNEPKTGDNYVSFGVFEGEPEWVEAFIDGVEKYVVLDFNVDGMILDLI